jgi:hypothetical protein
MTCCDRRCQTQAAVNLFNTDGSTLVRLVDDETFVLEALDISGEVVDFVHARRVRAA